MDRTGRVVSVNISERKGVPKTPISEGLLRKDHGLVGDAHAGRWPRQVSLLGIESLRKLKSDSETGLCNGSFAENITTEGLTLYRLPLGTRLKVGNTLQEISQIGKECHDECAIKKTVGQCVLPREGIFTRVLEGGVVRPGDAIEVIERKGKRCTG